MALADVGEKDEAEIAPAPRDCQAWASRHGHAAMTICRMRTESRISQVTSFAKVASRDQADSSFGVPAVGDVLTQVGQPPTV